MTLATFGLLLTAILLEVFGQVSFKLGTRRSSRVRSTAGGKLAHAGYLNRWISLGLGAYVVELSIWMAVLSKLQLSQAFPLLALSYCGVAFASRFIFKELLMPATVVGICLISFGAAMILWST